MSETLTVANLVKDLNLVSVLPDADINTKAITVSDISRPGLELTGYFNYYPKERIQLFGRTEMTYMANMTPEDRSDVLQKMATTQTPCFMISRGLKAPEEMLIQAQKNQIPIISSHLPTTRLSSLITEYLEAKLAERTSMHGVLVDIFGVGVLIIGDSGVGKSETALELVQRGHRLIADDRVDVYQKDEQTIMGEPAAILRHLLEIRGIGIIDVMNLFGAGAVRSEAPINLIVRLRNWEPGQNYDRLGSGEEYQKIFEVNVPRITIPVKVGRNVASIIEVATMNFRAKNMGFDATKTFENNLSRLIENNSGQ